MPPADYLKWARICEHIILHYNEGWANGLHLGIEYWEIWNEPDGAPNWTGTQEEYCRFYRTMVTYLKERFPHLKFGGPTCSWVYGEFPETFLREITKDGRHTPLDFFSWHAYPHDPRKMDASARRVRELLLKYDMTIPRAYATNGTMCAIGAALEKAMRL